jgi:flagellar motor component MotA
MDALTATGVALALIALVGGSVLKGAGIASLANPAAFVIVVVGTFAASLDPDTENDLHARLEDLPVDLQAAHAGQRRTDQEDGRLE